MFLLFSIIFLCGTQSIRPMDTSSTALSSGETAQLLSRYLMHHYQKPSTSSPSDSSTPTQHNSSSEHVAEHVTLLLAKALQKRSQNMQQTPSLENNAAQTNNKIGIPPHRALEDYTKSCLLYKEKDEKHPLIEDGHIVMVEIQIIGFNGKKQYQCAHCNKTFLSFNFAQRHIYHHLQLIFNCDQCTFHSTEPLKLTKHIREIHCTCCQKTFDSQELLKHHSKTQRNYHNLHIKPISMKKNNASKKLKSKHAKIMLQDAPSISAQH